MILKPIDSSIVQTFFSEFKRKAKYFETPSENSQYIGVYEEDVLLGYFITLAYVDDMSIDILQGYLKPEYQHMNIPNLAMEMLEDIARKKGFKIIRCRASRSLKAYIKFMASCGFAPKEIIFSKNIEV